MSADRSDRSLLPGRERRRRRSLGAEIFARTLADRRVLIRKLVVGEAIGERPLGAIAGRPAPGPAPEAEGDLPPR